MAGAFCAYERIPARRGATSVPPNGPFSGPDNAVTCAYLVSEGGLERPRPLRTDRLVLEYHPRGYQKQKPSFGVLVSFRPGEVRPFEVRPTKVRPTKILPTKIRPFEVRPTEIRPTEIRPTESRPPDALPAKIRTGQI